MPINSSVLMYIQYTQNIKFHRQAWMEFNNIPHNVLIEIYLPVGDEDGLCILQLYLKYELLHKKDIKILTL